VVLNYWHLVEVVLGKLLSFGNTLDRIAKTGSLSDLDADL
jgi:hypothetical protein